MTIDLATLARIGQGRAAEVFTLDEDRVIKVARPEVADSLEREAAALRAAHAAGMPVPTPYELVVVDGRRALVMGRARGVDMLTGFAKRPWTLLRAGSKLGRLHALLHETATQVELPSARDVIAKRIAESTNVPDAVRGRIQAVLAMLPDGDRLCHFDFHPGNVITDGATMTVIDWPGACRGDALADVAATWIALRGGKTTPGTPLLTRLFAPLGRKLILGGYLRAYRKRRPIEPQSFARWQAVLACVRLTYEITGERELLLETIEERLR